MPNSPGTKQRSADVLFLISLLGVFAVSIVLVTVFGANTYRNIVSRSQKNYELTTSLSYVREKIRQNDQTGCILITTVDDTDVLSIKDSSSDSDYVTWIYFYEGSLRELFHQESNPLSLSAGQKILALDDFSMKQLSESLFWFSSVESGQTAAELTVTLHSNQD